MTDQLPMSTCLVIAAYSIAFCLELMWITIISQGIYKRLIVGKVANEHTALYYSTFILIFCLCFKSFFVVLCMSNNLKSIKIDFPFYFNTIMIMLYQTLVLMQSNSYLNTLKDILWRARNLPENLMLTITEKKRQPRMRQS